MAIFGSLITDICVFLVTILIYNYLNIRRRYTTYLKRGIACVTPYRALWSALRMFSGRYSFGFEYMELYKATKDKSAVVASLGPLPIYLINDPKVVHDILTTNFSQFHDRGFRIDDKTNPLEGHLFMLSGEKWRFMRNKLSPTFTSGKLKGMHPLINSCSDVLIKILSEKDEVEVRDMIACFTTDVIGSCAFGIEPTAMYDPNCEFRVMGKKVFSQDLKQIFMGFIRMNWPDFFFKLKLKTVPEDLNNFFFGLIRSTFEKRLQGEKRNDFVQLLLQLREKGQVEVDNKDDEEFKELDTRDLHYKSTFDLTDEVLAAQAFVFYFAGFETTATAMSFALYLFSKNQDIQEKARQEVREMKEKYGGINYQSVKEMVYLEACLNEALRLYPPVNILFRKAKHTFTLEDGTVIDKGAQIILPVSALQSDPSYFPNPEQFDPERFMPEASVIPGTFIPFGDGPRTCIGKRFAIIEAKTGLASILDNFKLENSNKTQEPLKMNPRAGILNPHGGLWVKFIKINE